MIDERGRAALAALVALWVAGAGGALAHGGEAAQEGTGEAPAARASVCALTSVGEPVGQTLQSVARGLGDAWGGPCKAVGDITLTVGEASVAVFECGEAFDYYGTIVVVERDGQYWSEVLASSSVGMEELERHEVTGFELVKIAGDAPRFVVVVHEMVEHLARQEDEEGELGGFADVGGFSRVRVLDLGDAAPSWQAAVRTHDPVEGTAAALEWRYGGQYEVVAVDGHEPSTPLGTFTLGSPEQCRPASP